MESENIYKAPEADLSNDTDFAQDGAVYSGPKSCKTGKALDWISGGFAIFKAYPGQWIITMIVGFILAIVIQLIPIVGAIAAMLTTFIWPAGLIMGCHAVRKGQPFQLEYLFAGFKNRLGALLGLSLLYMFVFLVLMIGAMGTLYIDLLMGDPAAVENLDPTNITLKILIVMALAMPIIMAVWFAPTLIVLQQMPLFVAIKESFYGCLKNVLPFLVYGIVMLVLYFIAAIPLLLGLLVLVPTFFGSVYVAYEDIFLTKSEEGESAQLS